MNIEKLDVSPDLLGESPVWEPGRLFWIDAWRCLVRALHPSSGRHQSWTAPGRIESIALMPDNRILVALRSGALQQLDLDTSQWTPLAAIRSPDPNTYLNDGKTDRRGRFVCGSVAGNGKPVGKLYRFTAPDRIETLAAGIRLSNGICFSPSGDRMYFTDTLARKIQAFPYDPDNGTVGAPSCLFDVTSIDSMADGATVDSGGHLWASMPRTGEIARISPDGELLQLIKMPVEFRPALPSVATTSTLSTSQQGLGFGPRGVEASGRRRGVCDHGPRCARQRGNAVRRVSSLGSRADKD